MAIVQNTLKLTCAFYIYMRIMHVQWWTVVDVELTSGYP